MTSDLIFGTLATVALAGWGWTNWKWSQTLGNIVVSKVRLANEQRTRNLTSGQANPVYHGAPPIGEIPPMPDMGPINDVIARMRENSNAPDVWPTESVEVEESS